MKHCRKLCGCCGNESQGCGCCGCGHEQMPYDPDFELAVVPQFECGCKPHVAPPCLKPCWDTCKCMDEIIDLKDLVQNLTEELELLKARVKYNEEVENNHYNHLVRLYGTLSQTVNDYYNELKNLINEIQGDIVNKYNTLVNQITSNSLWVKVNNMLKPKDSSCSVQANKFYDTDPNI